MRAIKEGESAVLAVFAGLMSRRETIAVQPFLVFFFFFQSTTHHACRHHVVCLQGVGSSFYLTD